MRKRVFFALSDGTDVIAFGSAQDHKRVGDGDVGPNTGGMGAYSPAPVLTADLEAQVMDRIIRPTVATLAAEGTPYVGVLFAGLMLTDAGPKLIEYNARFGDPECQVLMMRYAGDLAALLHAASTGELAGATPPAFASDYALTVVMAANGYPATPEKRRRDPRHCRRRSRRRQGLSRRNGTERRPDRRCGWPRAQRHRNRTHRDRSAGACLCRGRQARFRGGLLPPRHWLARSRTRSGVNFRRGKFMVARSLR